MLVTAPSPRLRMTRFQPSVCQRLSSTRVGPSASPFTSPSNVTTTGSGAPTRRCVEAAERWKMTRASRVSSSKTPEVCDSSRTLGRLSGDAGEQRHMRRRRSASLPSSSRRCCRPRRVTADSTHLRSPCFPTWEWETDIGLSLFGGGGSAFPAVTTTGRCTAHLARIRRRIAIGDRCLGRRSASHS